MADEIATTDELDAIEALIDEWLAEELAENPAIAAVDRDAPGKRRWFVRMRGEQKETFTVWFHLDQRTLQYETYVMPAPDREPRRAVRAPAASQPQALRRRVRHRRRGRRVPRRPAGRARDRPRASSTGCSARSTSGSSSSSARPCASATPASSTRLTPVKLAPNFHCLSISVDLGWPATRRAGPGASGKVPRPTARLVDSRESSGLSPPRPRWQAGHPASPGRRPTPAARRAARPAALGCRR